MPRFTQFPQDEVLRQFRAWFEWVKQSNIDSSLFCNFIQPLCTNSRSVGQSPRTAGITYHDIITQNEQRYNSPTIEIEQRHHNKILKDNGKENAIRLLKGFMSLDMDFDKEVRKKLINLFCYSYSISAAELKENVKTKSRTDSEQKKPNLAIRRQAVPHSSSNSQPDAADPNPIAETKTPKFSAVLFRPLPVSPQKISYDALLSEIKYLRTDSDCVVDCMLLTDTMMNFLTKGKKPHPVALHEVELPKSSGKMKPRLIKIKTEPTEAPDAEEKYILGHSQHFASRPGFFSELPPKQIPLVTIEEKTSPTTQLILDDKASPDESVYYQNFERWALEKAVERGGSACGTLTYKRLGRYFTQNGHTLNWLAFNDGKDQYVLCIDAQLWNGKTNRGAPIYSPITSGATFLTVGEPGPDTFDPTIFCIVYPNQPHFVVEPSSLPLNLRLNPARGAALR